MLHNQKLQIYSANDVIRIIKHFPLRKDNDVSKVPFEYQNKDSNECTILRDKWSIPEEFTYGEKTLSSIIRLLSWYKDHFRFNKNQYSSSGIEALIESSPYQLIYEKLKKEEISFTPLFEALFFLYVLLSTGYKARLVNCTSLGFYDAGIYFVEAYLFDLKKWVAVDITNNSIYYDGLGVPLNIFELRQLITDRKNVFIYCGEKEIHSDIYNALIYNLFKIIYWKDNKINMLGEKKEQLYILTSIYLKGSNKKIIDQINGRECKYVFINNSNCLY